MNEVAKFESVSETVLNRSGNIPELFVINLCAAMTPMPSVPRNLKGFEKYKLYQVSRQEDGRRRFRLRLGFFTNEADAEWVLNSVRNLYPTAFTSCVTQDDMRYFGDAQAPTATATPQPVPAPIPTQAAPNPVQVVKTTPPVVPVPAPIPTAVEALAARPAVAKPVAAKTPPAAPKHTPKETPKQTLTADIPAVVAAKPLTATSSQPFHVARGVQVPETNLELTDEHPVLPAPTNLPAAASVAPAARAVARAAAKPAASASTPRAAAGPILSAILVNPPKVVDDYVPILDTTLTIRTLTSAEAEDSNRPKWFVVQLALSDQPINLDTMPKLDIFAAYTLYSVAMMEGGTIKHALRLGFFKENVSADAVMGYLKAFFSTPSVTQIATAEYDRFAESKSKPQTSATEAKVVDLKGKRPATAPARPAPAAVTKPTSPSNRPSSAAKPKDTKARVAPPPRPQSFLSRLIGRQLD